MPLPVAATFIAVRNARVQNSGGAETDLLTIWVPPGILRNVGDALRITTSVFIASNVNSKTDKTYFDTAVLSGRTISSSGFPRVNMCMVYKRAPGQQAGVGINNEHGQAALVKLIDITADDSSPIIIRLTGQGVADGDMESRLLMVEYVPVGTVFGF